jgi:hypothetical protein
MAMLCDACSSDAQCAGTNDLCIPVGSTGGTFCGQWCGETGAANCPTGYSCSATALKSVGGSSHRQCLPNAGVCGAVMQSCVPNMFEPNDALAMAAALGDGAHTGIDYCPGPSGAADEDWYSVAVTADANIDVTMSYTIDATHSDLDLELVAADGTVLESSLGATGSEHVAHCVAGSAGKVFLRVFTFDSVPVNPNVYSLTITRTAMSCAAPVCMDALDPNNTPAMATDLGTPLYPTVADFPNLQICANEPNGDWFAQQLLDGDNLVVDCLFTQLNESQDLDIHLWKADATAPGGVTDLTPCPPCDVNNGQGSVSNEHFTWTVATGQGGQYYVVVVGYMGATNAYELKATIH